MKRLRHPVRAIREPFGTAGLIVACIALIAALGGTALAAKGALTGKQKKEVEKIAKKFAGKPGAAGATGPQGPAGKDGNNGTNGTNGKDGTNGTNGKDGTNGVDGETPVGTAFAGDEEPEFEGDPTPCNEEGGVAYEELVNVLCNGAEGSPWTVGGTLPPGATETGAWLVSGSKAEAEDVNLNEGLYAPISFPIPLENGIPEDHVIYVEGLPTPAECKPDGGFANVVAPYADPGYLCVFVNSGGAPPLEFVAIEQIVTGVFGAELGANTAGARLKFKFNGEPADHAITSGTFAVTAP